MRGKVFPFGDLRGGLNTRDSAYEIAPNQARDLSNVSGSVNGAVRKRDGRTQFSTLTNPANGAIVADALSPGQILAVDSVAPAFRTINTGGVASALTLGAGVTVGTARWRFIMAPPVSGQGPVFGMNGANTPVRWDGGTTVNTWTATAGNLPNGKYLVSMGNRVFAAGMSAYTPSGGSALTDPGSALVFSDIGNPLSWPGANVVLFDPNDGDVITGLGAIGPYLLVFKRKKVFLVYDLNTGANRRLSANVGCASHDTIVETPGGTFFLFDDGVYLTNGSKVELVSDIITPTVRAILSANIGLATAVVFNNHYYLSASFSGAANDVTLDYDIALQSWWRHTIGVSKFLPWRPSAAPLLLATDASAARISQLFVPSTPTDFGAAFEAYWTGAWLAPGDNVRRHRLREVLADLSGHVQLNLARDFAGAPGLVRDFNYVSGSSVFGGTGLFGDGTFGDPSTTRQAKAPTPSPSVGRAFSLQWYSNHTDPWQLEAFNMLIGDRTN